MGGSRKEWSFNIPSFNVIQWVLYLFPSADFNHYNIIFIFGLRSERLNETLPLINDPSDEKKEVEEKDEDINRSYEINLKDKKYDYF